MKNIIIGRNFGNVLGQIRNFGEVGMNPIVIWFGNDEHTPKDSKYVSGFFEVGSIEEGVDLLLYKFAEKGEKHLLSTDNDGFVMELNNRFDELSEYFYFYNAGSNGRLSEMMEKENLCNLAHDVGLRIPQSELVKKGDYPKLLNYPIITKASNSYDYNWKDCVAICKDSNELDVFYEKQTSDFFLIQEFVEKKDELILQGLCVNDGNDIYIPIQGGYYRIPEGAYGTYLHFEKNKVSEDIVEKLKRMFSIIKYNGVFEVEFIVGTNDKLYFLEINFRHTLWTHAFTDMGVNLSKIWADSVINNKIIGKVDSFHTPHTLIFEVRDFRMYVKTHKINLSKWIKELVKADSLLFWDRKDPKPFFVWLWVEFRVWFKRHIKKQ